MTETTTDRNVTLIIKMKKDFISVPMIARSWDHEGFYIGEDLYLLSEFSFDEDAERFHSLDGKLQIQI